MLCYGGIIYSPVVMVDCLALCLLYVMCYSLFCSFLGA